MGTNVNDSNPKAIPDLNSLELTLETITRARFVALSMGTSLSQAVEFLLGKALSEYESRGLQEGPSGAYTSSPKAAPSASSGTNTKATKAAQLQNAYKVEGVPALGVAGRFYVDGDRAKSMANALKLVEYLVAGIRSGR